MTPSEPSRGVLHVERVFNGATSVQRAALAHIVALMFGCAVVAARADAIYKCTDATGHVTYQSSACSNGHVVDIDAGSFNAHSAQRLREDDADWSKRADARRAAADAQAHLQAAADAATAHAAANAIAAAPACTYCDGWNSALAWSYPPWRPHHPRPHPPPPVTRTPYIVIR
ncbi:MAG: DUF4124 domain-containing protein [Casimicrobiaceae bacterium]